MKFSKFSLRWLPVTQLVVHPRVQRDFKPAWATKLASELDPDKFGTLTVVPGEKSVFRVVDGQHRLAAVRELYGEAQMVPCALYDNDDDAFAAKVFLGRNNSKGVSGLDKFRVRLIAGDDRAAGIKSLLGKHKLKVAASRGAGVVQAVSACEAIYGRSPDLLDRTIGILSEAWGSNPDAYFAELVRGVALVAGRFNGDLDDADLSRKLAKTTPVRMVGDARDTAKVMHLSTAQAAAVCIVNEYNRGRRSSRLPGWQEQSA